MPAHRYRGGRDTRHHHRHACYKFARHEALVDDSDDEWFAVAGDEETDDEMAEVDKDTLPHLDEVCTGPENAEDASLACTGPLIPATSMDMTAVPEQPQQAPPALCATSFPSLMPKSRQQPASLTASTRSMGSNVPDVSSPQSQSKSKSGDFDASCPKMRKRPSRRNRPSPSTSSSSEFVLDMTAASFPALSAKRDGTPAPSDAAATGVSRATNSGCSASTASIPLEAMEAYASRIASDHKIPCPAGDGCILLDCIYKHSPARAARVAACSYNCRQHTFWITDAHKRTVSYPPLFKQLVAREFASDHYSMADATKGTSSDLNAILMSDFPPAAQFFIPRPLLLSIVSNTWSSHLLRLASALHPPASNSEEKGCLCQAHVDVIAQVTDDFASSLKALSDRFVSRLPQLIDARLAEAEQAATQESTEDNAADADAATSRILKALEQDILRECSYLSCACFRFQDPGYELSSISDERAQKLISSPQTRQLRDPTQPSAAPPPENASQQPKQEQPSLLLCLQRDGCPETPVKPFHVHDKHLCCFRPFPIMALMADIHASLQARDRPVVGITAAVSSGKTLALPYIAFTNAFETTLSVQASAHAVNYAMQYAAECNLSPLPAPAAFKESTTQSYPWMRQEKTVVYASEAALLPFLASVRSRFETLGSQVSNQFNAFCRSTQASTAALSSSVENKPLSWIDRSSLLGGEINFSTIVFDDCQRSTIEGELILEILRQWVHHPSIFVRLAAPKLLLTSTSHASVLARSQCFLLDDDAIHTELKDAAFSIAADPRNCKRLSSTSSPLLQRADPLQCLLSSAYPPPGLVCTRSCFPIVSEFVNSYRGLGVPAPKELTVHMAKFIADFSRISENTGGLVLAIFPTQTEAAIACRLVEDDINQPMAESRRAKKKRSKNRGGKTEAVLHHRKRVACLCPERSAFPLTMAHIKSLLKKCHAACTHAILFTADAALQGLVVDNITAVIDCGVEVTTRYESRFSRVVSERAWATHQTTQRRQSYAGSAFHTTVHRFGQSAKEACECFPTAFKSACPRKFLLAAINAIQRDAIPWLRSKGANEGHGLEIELAALHHQGAVTLLHQTTTLEDMMPNTLTMIGKVSHEIGVPPAHVRILMDGFAQLKRPQNALLLCAVLSVQDSLPWRLRSDASAYRKCLVAAAAGALQVSPEDGDVVLLYRLVELYLAIAHGTVPWCEAAKTCEEMKALFYDATGEFLPFFLGTACATEECVHGDAPNAPALRHAIAALQQVSKNTKAENKASRSKHLSSKRRTRWRKLRNAGLQEEDAVSLDALEKRFCDELCLSHAYFAKVICKMADLQKQIHALYHSDPRVYTALFGSIVLPFDGKGTAHNDTASCLATAHVSNLRLRRMIFAGFHLNLWTVMQPPKAAPSPQSRQTWCEASTPPSERGSTSVQSYFTPQQAAVHPHSLLTEAMAIRGHNGDEAFLLVAASSVVHEGETYLWPCTAIPVDWLQVLEPLPRTTADPGDVALVDVGLSVRHFRSAVDGYLPSTSIGPLPPLLFKEFWAQKWQLGHDHCISFSITALTSEPRIEGDTCITSADRNDDDHHDDHDCNDSYIEEPQSPETGLGVIAYELTIVAASSLMSKVTSDVKQLLAVCSQKLQKKTVALCLNNLGVSPTSRGSPRDADLICFTIGPGGTACEILSGAASLSLRIDANQSDLAEGQLRTMLTQAAATSEFLSTTSFTIQKVHRPTHIPCVPHDDKFVSTALSSSSGAKATFDVHCGSLALARHFVAHASDLADAVPAFSGSLAVQSHEGLSAIDGPPSEDALSRSAPALALPMPKSVEKLYADSEQSLECGVCWSRAEEPVLLQCGHVHCRDCLKGLIDQVVGGNLAFLPLSCPKDGCTHQLQFSEFWHFYQATADLERLAAILTNHLVQTGSAVAPRGTYRMCPSPGCKGIATHRPSTFLQQQQQQDLANDALRQEPLCSLCAVLDGAHVSHTAPGSRSSSCPYEQPDSHEDIKRLLRQRIRASVAGMRHDMGQRPQSLGPAQVEQALALLDRFDEGAVDSATLTRDILAVLWVTPSSCPVLICDEAVNHQCNQCNITHCLRCSEHATDAVESHDPQVECVRAPDRMYDVADGSMKPCPGCYSMTVKHSGCNHMHCSRCSVHWCWKCGVFYSQEASDVYSHLSRVHGGLFT